MADIDLPVFSFLPDWAGGVTENLSFLTDVLRAEEGAEQRRILRLTPRRTLEADFLLYGADRTFWDLFMSRLSGGEIMVPLYWDIGRLSATLVPAVTNRLDLDTRWTEFAPGLAIIAGKRALEYEVVEIVAVDDDGLDLAAPVDNPWPVGSAVMPLRRALIDDTGEVSHLSDRVATVSVQIGFSVRNPWVDQSVPVFYSGFPVFVSAPDWSGALGVAYDLETLRLDNTTGLPYQVDSLGRALLGQSHRWFLAGRERLAGFRDILYRHMGRAGALWLPTFKDDLRIVVDIAAVDDQIAVESVGYIYVGGPASGREHIALRTASGTVFRRVLAVSPGPSPAIEILELDGPVGLDLATGQDYQLSFADLARFDQDDFSLVHRTDTLGLTEVNAMFRTFKGTRTNPLPVSYPIPTAAMIEGTCGEAVDMTCYS